MGLKYEPTSETTAHFCEVVILKLGAVPSCAVAPLMTYRVRESLLLTYPGKLRTTTRLALSQDKVLNQKKAGNVLVSPIPWLFWQTTKARKRERKREKREKERERERAIERERDSVCACERESC
jgi:hypothetical protein